MEPTIIFEDNHLLAINKPAGWLVQADRTGDFTLSDWGKSYLKEKYAKPGAVFLHPAHRIDRPVSGAVLFGRTDKALARLATIFRDRKLDKTYLALTLRTPKNLSGELQHYLLKDDKRNTVEVYSKPRGEAKAAITRYEVLNTFDDLTLLRVSPITGRPHQIRAQLNAIGCPILGDLKYGAPSALPDASIGLHCLGMKFIHPVKLEEIHITAELPQKEWWEKAGEMSNVQ